MSIFHYNDQKLIAVDKTTFGNEGVFERNDLQAALKKDISAISDDLLVIAEEFAEWSEGQRRIDLLAIDKQANIVVIELKRNETGGHMELQAIRYAAMISMLTWQETIEIFNRYLKKEYPDETRNAEQELLDFLGWDDAQEDEFGPETHIVLVSADFSSELTTSVMWLNDAGLNIKCVQIKPHKFNGEILINVQPIIPLPEAKDYQEGVKRKGEEKKAARNSGQRNLTEYRFKGEIYNKRRLVLAVIQCWVKENNPQNYDALVSVFPEKLSGWYVFLPLNEADRFYFTKEGEPIELNDESSSSYAVCKQWSGKAYQRFVDLARKLGYEIEAVDPSNSPTTL